MLWLKNEALKEYFKFHVSHFEQSYPSVVKSRFGRISGLHAKEGLETRARDEEKTRFGIWELR